MKKILLSLMAAAVAMSASAFGLDRQPVRPALTNGIHGDFTVADITFAAPQKAPAGPQKASGTINYTLAGDPYSCTNFNGVSAKMEIAQAFIMTPDVTTMYAGAQITGITYYTGGRVINNQLGNNYCNIYTGFISEDFDTEPLAKASDFSGSTPFTKKTVRLDAPFTIEAGKTYVIGVYTSIPTVNDWPIVFDALQYPQDQWLGGFAGYRASSSDKFNWIDLAEQGLGFVCVGCNIKSDNLPENMASVVDYDITPAVNANKEFEIGFMFKNEAANAITSLQYTYQIGEETPVSGTANVASTAYNKTGTYYIENAKSSTTGANVPITLTITGVNGKDNNTTAQKSFTGNTSVLPEGMGYKRNLVIEEATSINCGWCPYGAIALENIKKNYPDGSFAPVAIHTYFNGADPMQVTSYQPFIQTYITGFPSAVINRMIDTGLGAPPSSLMPQMSMYYSYIRSIPGLMDISMDCRWTDEKMTAIECNVKNSFVFDYADGTDYRLSFVCTEDNVGPYTQTNYLNGESDPTGELEGWNTAGGSVRTTFNDVARKIDTYEGIEGSIPAAIEAGKEYTYNHTFTLPSAVKNKNTVCMLCFVVNTKTGVIENVAYVRPDKIAGGDSGICDIVTDDSQAPVEYYNLQGIRVNDPQGGVFIRRQGNTVTKVIK